jgi:hypothetical protein
MQTRREFVIGMLSTIGLFSIADPLAFAVSQPPVFQGENVFNRILTKAVEGKWSELPISELMGKIARELEGTPYVAHTLELSPEREMCSVNLTGLDCVTFFETTLNFARMLKKGGRTPEALLAEVTYTRYRDGVVGDYTSRLHYTTDWFRDNEKKHVVKLLSDLPGAEPFTQKVGFMSAHPDKYSHLAANPQLVAKIKAQEDAINACPPLKYIPLNKLAAVEPLLKTGDIVGVCTSIAGIDIAHTGLVYRTADGVAHFMDASSGKNKMKVTLEPGPISKALTWSPNLTGAIFARPLEP